MTNMISDFKESAKNLKIFFGAVKNEKNNYFSGLPSLL